MQGVKENPFVALCLVRHTPGGKPFLFEAPAYKVSEGDDVMVDTFNGKASGVVIAVTHEVRGSSGYNFALAATGAKEPLRRVLAICQYLELPEPERTVNRTVENEALPF